jgi:hypothetical protein
MFVDQAISPTAANIKKPKFRVHGD